MRVGDRDYRTLWMTGGIVRMIDQPLLPHRFAIRDCPTHRVTAQAIRDMVTRGAGAIGVAAGYAMAQAALEAPDDDLAAYTERARLLVTSTRPTAQNLFYAVDRVFGVIQSGGGPAEARRRAVEEAEAIADEDVAAGRAIGELGADLMPDGGRILTHCNAGWLAFADWGTALAPVYVAHRRGKRLFVFVDETRPRLQGAALTAWELGQEGIEHTIIADNAAGYYLQRGEVDLVIVGADRIAYNGDVANKIGTYEKAVVAKDNGVPFYVAAPLSTVDVDSATGRDIPIEERSPDEVLCVRGADGAGAPAYVRVAPSGSPARNPAFDVTPARLITGILTERGIVAPERLAGLLARSSA
jgi:S-methyl-5-thioribose-1-phosphate isomerase